MPEELGASEHLGVATKFFALAQTQDVERQRLGARLTGQRGADEAIHARQVGRDRLELVGVERRVGRAQQRPGTREIEGLEAHVPAKAERTGKAGQTIRELFASLTPSRSALRGRTTP